jgi:hypothetical protein
LTVWFKIFTIIRKKKKTLMLLNSLNLTMFLIIWFTGINRVITDMVNSNFYLK